MERIRVFFKFVLHFITEYFKSHKAIARMKLITSISWRLQARLSKQVYCSRVIAGRIAFYNLGQVLKHWTGNDGNKAFNPQDNSLCFRSRKTSANTPNSTRLTNLKYPIKINEIACGILRFLLSFKYSTTNALSLSLDRVINFQMWVAFRPKRDGRIKCQISKAENWNPKNRKYRFIHI